MNQRDRSSTTTTEHHSRYIVSLGVVCCCWTTHMEIKTNKRIKCNCCVGGCWRKHTDIDSLPAPIVVAGSRRRHLPKNSFTYGRLSSTIRNPVMLIAPYSFISDSHRSSITYGMRETENVVLENGWDGNLLRSMHASCTHVCSCAYERRANKWMQSFECVLCMFCAAEAYRLRIRWLRLSSRPQLRVPIKTNAIYFSGDWPPGGHHHRATETNNEQTNALFVLRSERLNI